MTLHSLLNHLAHRSTLIAGMNLAATLPDTALSNGLRYLAGTPSELDRVARCIDSLGSVAGLATRDAEVMIRNLLSQNTFYGQFCEIGAYDWMLRHDALFSAQLSLGAADCLNPNGITIDGKFSSRDVYFDVKAMGFQTYVTDQFRRKLQSLLPQFKVQIDGSMDVAVKDIEQYAFRALRDIRQALSTGGRHAIPELNWTVRAEAPRRIHLSTQTSNPYALAEENRFYPFKTASQFTLNNPFVMVFSYNAVINQNLFVNFASSTDITLRALARRAFLQFIGDATPLQTYDSKTARGATLGNASELLSALLFIDFASDDARLYLNPKARHKILKDHVEEIFDFALPTSMSVEDFEHDVY